jgi:hypothetical protein
MDPTQNGFEFINLTFILIRNALNSEFNHCDWDNSKNKNMVIHMDGLSENFNFSRFDRTSIITEVKFLGIPLSNIERMDHKDEDPFP